MILLLLCSAFRLYFVCIKPFLIKGFALLMMKQFHRDKGMFWLILSPYWMLGMMVTLLAVALLYQFKRALLRKCSFLDIESISIRTVSYFIVVGSVLGTLALKWTNDYEDKLLTLSFNLRVQHMNFVWMEDTFIHSSPNFERQKVNNKIKNLNK